MTDHGFDLEKLKRVTAATHAAVKTLYPDWDEEDTSDPTFVVDLLADVMIHMSFLSDDEEVDVNRATYTAEERTLKLLAFIGIDVIDPSSFEDCAYVGAALSCFFDEDLREDAMDSAYLHWRGEIEGDDITEDISVEMFKP